LAALWGAKAYFESRENKKLAEEIFEKTPFYAEGGGQVGDTGNLYTSEKKLVGKITDTKKLDGNIFLHYLKNNILYL